MRGAEIDLPSPRISIPRTGIAYPDLEIPTRGPGESIPAPRERIPGPSILATLAAKQIDDSGILGNFRPNLKANRQQLSILTTHETMKTMRSSCLSVAWIPTTGSRGAGGLLRGSLTIDVPGARGGLPWPLAYRF